MNHRLFRPFRAWIGCGRAHPGALPRAGVCRAVGAPGSWQALQSWGRLVGRLVRGIGVASKHVTKGITIMARPLRALVLDVRVACRPGLGLAPGRRGISGYVLGKGVSPPFVTCRSRSWRQVPSSNAFNFG